MMISVSTSFNDEFIQAQDPLTILRGADQIHETFVQNVSHELRTPLALVMGYAELLRSDTFGELAPAQQEALTIILNRSQQIQTIVDRVGILLSSQANMTAFSPVCLAEVVSELAAEFQPEFAKAAVTLHYAPPAVQSQVMGDRNHLRHLVACLLDNALKFTPAQNETTVSVTAVNGHLTISVADTGIGMSAATLEAIERGSRFFQADRGAARQYGGLGLGLTLVSAVARTHRGELTVASELGKGSRFTVALPILREETAVIPISDLTPPHHILVVDDEPDVALVMQQALQRLPNCEVVTANNAAEALALCAERQFDLLLTDYNMPGDDGVSLIKQARQHWPHTQAIMITAHDNRELRHLATAAAIDHVLDKRVKLSEIQQIVRRALQHENGAAVANQNQN